MNTEIYITTICLIIASTILLLTFRFDHWRKRVEIAEHRAEAADRRVANAEAALARVEAVIANAISDHSLVDLVEAAERAVDAVEVSK